MNRNGFIMDPGYGQHHPGLVYAPLPGPQENYVVVQAPQIVQAPQRAAPPGPVRLPGQGRNFVKNLRRRQRREAQEQMDPGPAVPQLQDPRPVVPQPQGILQVAMQAAGVGEVADQPVPKPGPGPGPEPGPGYQTVDYTRSQKSQVVGQDRISLAQIIDVISKLHDYAVAFTKCLVSPSSGPRVNIVALWRYACNGSVVKTGANLMLIIMEIMSFFHKNGCPVKECPFLKPALAALQTSEPVTAHILEGIMDPTYLDAEYAELTYKVNLITESGTYDMAKEAVDMMESFMPIYARQSATAVQPCIRFTLSSDTPRIGKETLTVYNEAASPRYREMFQQLNITARNQLRVTTGAEKLLKPLGLSVDKFKGLIRCESRAEEEIQDDGSYPSKAALQQLFGISTEWDDVKNMLLEQISPHLAQVSRNAELLYNQRAKLEEIHTLLRMMADISNLRSKVIEVPDTGSGKPESKPELRVLLKNYISKRAGLTDKPVEMADLPGPADKPVTAADTSADATDPAQVETVDALMDEAEI